MSKAPASSGRQSKSIFISYSHADSESAAQIRLALEQAGLKPWIDSVEIEPGQSFLHRMNVGLSEASYLLALISKNSTVSLWVNREWMAALANRDIVFIPVV